MSYIGTEPKDIRSFGRTKFDYTASQGQTAFTGADDDGKVLAFTTGQINVFGNGIFMDDSDFTTTGTGTVTLASAANLNDIISIVSFESNIPDNDYVPATGGTFTGNITASGTLGVTGAVTASNGLTVDDDGATPLTVDRATDNGDIIDLQKDGTSVGNIAVDSNDNIMFGAKTGGGAGFYLHGSGGTTPFVLPMKENALSDNTVTLGDSTRRYKDLYLGGGAYLGGTTSVNYLDDYEEGTFTPTLGGSTTAGVNNEAANAYGRYIKIGQMVHFSLHIGCATWSTAPSGYLRIFNMPFTSIGSNGQCSGAVMHNHLNTGGMDLVWYWTNATNMLRMYYCSDNAGWVQQPIYNEAQDYYISGTVMVQ